MIDWNVVPDLLADIDPSVIERFLATSASSDEIVVYAVEDELAFGEALDALSSVDEGRSSFEELGFETLDELDVNREVMRC